MARRERVLAGLLVVAAAGFLLGLGRLLVLRFAAGDIYEHYSSLRAGPTGTKVLHDGLAEVGGLTIQRSYRPLSKLGRGEGATLLILGAEPNDVTAFDVHDANGLERFVAGGGRLVMTFLPQRLALMGSTRPATGPDTLPASAWRENLPRRWGFHWAAMGDGSLPARMQAVPAGEDPNAGADGLGWHTRLYFRDLDPNWRVVYRCGTRPAIIARPLGAGSIVLAADTFFVSNEAMRRQRRPELLAWLVGPAKTVLFDETHLGVLAEPGVVALGRKHGLEGVLAAAGLLAVLFIWRSATTLVPRRRQESSASLAVQGRDSSAGLVNLLRQAARPRDILEVCFDQWLQGVGPGRRDLARKVEQMRQVIERQKSLPPRKRDTVSAYHELARIVAERM